MSITFWMLIIAVLAFFGNIAIALVGGTWIIGKTYAKLIKETDSKLDQIQIRFGESLSAIRNKMVDMEIWNRDHLVGKDTFYLVIGEIKDIFKRIEDKLDRRMDRLEGKIDERNENSNSS